MLFYLSQTFALAQKASDKGWVETSTGAGCASLTIELTHTGNRSGTLFYDFEGDQNDRLSLAGFDGSFSDGQKTTFTYSTPGTYLIRVVDQSGAGSLADRFDFIEIRVIEDRAPFVGISICNNNTAQFIFDFSGDFFDFYNIDFGDGNTMQLPKTGNNTIIHTYSQPGTYNMTAQGQLTSGDNSSCTLIRQEQITTITKIPSPTIDSLIVRDQIESTLYFQPLNDRLVYNLEIDFGSGFEFFQSIPPQTNNESFIIRDLGLDNLNQFYRYRIAATDFCGSASVYSDPISSIAFNTSLASFDNGIEISLNWQTSANGFNTLDYFIEQNFQQSFNTPTNSAGFTITFNNCEDFGSMYLEHIFNGKLSRSIVSTPFQGQNLDLPPPQTPVGRLDGVGITLDFVSPAFQVREYLIFRADETGAFQQIASTATNTYQDRDIPSGVSQVCYVIRYVDECGNTSQQSTETCITVSGLLRVPTAFTPNGDGINDIFKTADGIFQSFQLLIYNRWGTLVFQSSNPSVGWGGTFNGKPASMGTYTYRITFQNADNVPATKTGTFVLIR